MAWSAPSAAEFVTGEVVVASKMNAKITNNLRYLKGLDGAITLDDILGLRGAPTYTLDVLGADATMSGIRVRADGFTNPPVPGAITDATVINARGFNLTTDGVLVGAAYRPGLGMGMAASRVTPLIGLNNAGGPSILVEAGNVGIGTSAPAGKLNVYGPGGGWLPIFCNAVDGTLQTPVVAGTITQSAAFWGYDRNNTGGGLVQISGNMLALGGTFAFANTDTVTVTLTAGGAITVQRTAGTNGTHQVLMMVLYK